MTTESQDEVNNPFDKAFDAAFALIEQSEGNIEFARTMWLDVFEQAERIDHNQSLGEPYEFDRAVSEQYERFKKATAERQKFRVVKQEERPNGETKEPRGRP